MTLMIRMTRRAGWSFFGVLAALAFIATPVFAHTHLHASVPAKDAKLSQSPEKITLTFNGPVQVTAVAIESADGKQKQVIATLPAEKVKEVVLAAPKIAAGAHVIVWRAVGADGHVMAGKIPFSIGQ